MSALPLCRTCLILTIPMPAGHDHASLLFNFLDACLYAFASEDFVAKDMRALELTLPSGAAAAAAQAPPSASASGEGAPAFRLRAIA